MSTPLTMTSVDLGGPPETAAQRRRAQWARNLKELLETNARIGRTPSTPKQLHQAVVDAGVQISRQAVYLWLSGESAPSVENQPVIARVCGVPHHLLFPVEVPT